MAIYHSRKIGTQQWADGVNSQLRKKFEKAGFATPLFIKQPLQIIPFFPSLTIPFFKSSVLTTSPQQDSAMPGFAASIGVEFVKKNPGRTRGPAPPASA